MLGCPFAAFAEAAAERGMQTTLEFAKSLALSDLDSALAAVRYVDRTDFRRSGVGDVLSLIDSRAAQSRQFCIPCLARCGPR